MALIAKLARGSRRPPRRRRRLRSLAFVPNLMTLGNLLCGFAAIHFALRAMYDLGAGIGADEVETLDRAVWERVLPSFLSIGAGLVIVGMVLDSLDGLIARFTRSTTNFGGQLDSLADVVTFGVAPAALMVAVMTKELAGESILPSPISEHFLGRVTWISAALYVAFGAVRLARFNVEHAKADFDFRTFHGVPIPGAAVIMASLILLHESPDWLALKSAVAYALPVAAITTGFLMVSRVPYRRINRAYLVGRRPFGQFVVIVLVLAVFWSYKVPTLVVLTMWYGLSGPLAMLGRRLSGKRPTSHRKETDQTSEAGRNSA